MAATSKKTEEKKTTRKTASAKKTTTKKSTKKETAKKSTEFKLSSDEKKNIAIAAVLGVMASIFVIFLMEALNTSIKEPKDIEEKLGIPVFGVVPKY